MEFDLIVMLSVLVKMSGICFEFTIKCISRNEWNLV